MNHTSLVGRKKDFTGLTGRACTITVNNLEKCFYIFKRIKKVRENIIESKYFVTL